jgi:DNA polymerase
MNERRAAVLQELGIGPVWLRRTRPAMVAADAAVPVVRQEAPVAAVPPTPVSPPASADSAWDAPTQPAVALAIAPNHSDAEIAAMSWTQLQDAVSTCTRCGLCRSRTRAVFGSGDEKAHWLFVGEGPGRAEDQQGTPFVGPAGKLLDNMLQAMRQRRGENNFITNVVKCRPTDSDGKDRAPSLDESAACRPYLDRQIALLKPAIVVALGKVAALALLHADPKTPVGALRGVVHRYGNVPLVVTYHPAYLLRKPLDKSKSWRDMCLADAAFRDVGQLAI